jgi:hypothetical protein
MWAWEAMNSKNVIKNLVYFSIVYTLSYLLFISKTIYTVRII